ncbi:hypothetical protein B6D60_04420 [candidate division KSB1 bacterium 4484_87]|nr:MAG: hypothetical protein B6D60_04420 [candidate division KSB1 bacterium 4484_87]
MGGSIKISGRTDSRKRRNSIPADVGLGRDVNKIAEYGMVRTPGLVINNVMLLTGRIAGEKKLAQLLLAKLVKNS